MNKKISRVGYVLRLIRYVKGMWKYLVVSTLINILYKTIPIVISLITSYMISRATLGELDNVWQLFFAILIMIIFSVAISYLNVLISHDMAYRILAKLRSAAYLKIDEIAPAAMEERQSGELISIVLEDVEILEWFYAHTIGQLVTAFFIPLVALVLMWRISLSLPLTLLPFILALILIPIFAVKKSNRQGAETRQLFANLNAQTVDGVQGLKDIISFQWQNNFFRRFSQATEEYHAAQMQYALRSAGEMRFFHLIIGIGGLCGQIVAVLLVTNGQMSLPYLIPVFMLCIAVFAPLQDALTMSTNYGMIFSSAKRLFDLFQSASVVNDHGEKTFADVVGNKKGTDRTVQVSFNNVSFSYPSRNDAKPNIQILNGLQFSFGTGETVALVGASGSGKTTAAKLLQRFWDTDEGSITINGTDIRTIRLDSLRELVTIVPQEVYLFNTSIKENLLLANPDADMSRLYKAAEDARADSFIRRMPKGYDTRIGERGLKLSGGEKQRLSIAQAFLKDSPILIMDEMTANLDSENERLINQAVEQLKSGRATLVIAHRVSTIRKADRIVVIRDGRVEGIGSYHELVSACPYFTELIGEEYEE